MIIKIIIDIIQLVTALLYLTTAMKKRKKWLTIIIIYVI
ncbi:hypothetical protein LD85_0851 [Saccharolobus islandicus L.D.8.5]|uniref:Uncharacterized protein n=1 Tax=Saccharolobus islandicus (strain L.D.8.5 / Lassen \|nr:hypothetical protein LD85_0851 [Sulfolobus islandicus L.D.8.5]